MITFSCPLCGAMLTSEDASATAYCPSCTNTVIIPAEARQGNDPFAPTATPSTPPEPDWLDEARRELQQGNKIAASKIYKDNTGVGLKEAKDAVEAMQAGILPTLPLPVAAPVDRMAKIEQAMRRTQNRGH